MRKWDNPQGFTMVEMLVVIGIIAVLVAIIFPVYTTAREKARQARCRTNLMQLVTQLKAYRTDYGMYPAAWNKDETPWLRVGVWYDHTLSPPRYMGGFSSLYPDYIQDKNMLICPDDQDVKVLAKEAKDRVYSSYNGVAADPAGGDWTLDRVLYNYYGYTYVVGTDQGYSDGFEVAPADVIYPGAVPGWMDDWTGYDGNFVPDWLEYDGLSWQHFPALSNLHAPDNTIVSHCICHRDFYSAGREQDIIVRLSGETDTAEVGAMGERAATPTDPIEEVAPWVHQSF